MACRKRPPLPDILALTFVNIGLTVAPEWMEQEKDRSLFDEWELVILQNSSGSLIPSS